METSVRRMAEGDLHSVLALERVVYPTPWNLQHFARLIELPGGMGWVATVPPGEVVGYAVGWTVADQAELANLAVAVPWRRKGVGGQLLKVVSATAREAGAERLYLEVRISNAAAIAFYERHGFQIVGRRPDYYRGPREDALVMAIDLASPLEADGCYVPVPGGPGPGAG